MLSCKPVIGCPWLPKFSERFLLAADNFTLRWLAINRVEIAQWVIRRKTCFRYVAFPKNHFSKCRHAWHWCLLNTWNTLLKFYLTNGWLVFIDCLELRFLWCRYQRSSSRNRNTVCLYSLPSSMSVCFSKKNWRMKMLVALLNYGVVNFYMPSIH